MFNACNTLFGVRRSLQKADDELTSILGIRENVKVFVKSHMISLRGKKPLQQLHFCVDTVRGEKWAETFQYAGTTI